MQYAIARKDGGVMIMSVIGDADPVAEIAKWPPELRALDNVADIHPVTKVLPDRAHRSNWTAKTVK